MYVCINLLEIQYVFVTACCATTLRKKLRALWTKICVGRVLLNWKSQYHFGKLKAKILLRHTNVPTENFIMWEQCFDLQTIGGFTGMLWYVYRQSKCVGACKTRICTANGLKSNYIYCFYHTRTLHLAINQIRPKLGCCARRRFKDGGSDAWKDLGLVLLE